MVGKFKSKRQEGFTIIEVLIVLAIAGLIMLIVFLAVPALQRNARNTTRRNDAATYLGAANEFITNNNGVLPTTAAHMTTINALANTSSGTVEPAAVVTAVQTSTVVIGTLQLVTGAKCSTVTVGDTIANPGRSIALRYSVEDSAGAAVKQCTEG